MLHVTDINMALSAGIIAVCYMLELLCRHAHIELPEYIYFVSCRLFLKLCHVGRHSLHPFRIQ
jgi:hypothetical protein